jgi:muramidase (phage lysozyme)
MPLTAYDPNNATQTSFLSALALGETGNAANAYSMGYGGVDLSSAELGTNGFPQWGGSGNTHAAGAFQFQPSTWASIASQFNLNFSNPEDQNAGAWYLAQQTYSAKTGGNLSDALSSGDYSGIQSALGGIWPSVNGNAASPTGLSGALSSGAGASIAGAASAATGGASSASPFSIVDTIENWFERFGLIIIGTLIIGAALWALLSNAGYVASPKKLMKAL